MTYRHEQQTTLGPEDAGRGESSQPMTETKASGSAVSGAASSDSRRNHPPQNTPRKGQIRASET